MSSDVKYSILFLSSAAKEFRKLPAHIQERAITCIDSLSSDRLPPGTKKIKRKK